MMYNSLNGEQLVFVEHTIVEFRHLCIGHLTLKQCAQTLRETSSWLGFTEQVCLHNVTCNVVLNLPS